MQTGDRVGGARIVGEAGKGAMGVVYRGRQDALGRDVAVKVIASERAADPEFRARFAREARAAGALSHPHIVAVYDAGEDAGRLYLTMQFVDGVDLATMLRRHGPMPADDAVEVVAQIASALDAAHAQRLVHRDVKPANIMVTRRDAGWHTYLTDFGITTRLGEAGLTRTGLALGTLDYMAPEQLVGDPYDHRADVYALGAVLYQTLTGRVPFPARPMPRGSMPTSTFRRPRSRRSSQGRLRRWRRRCRRSSDVRWRSSPTSDLRRPVSWPMPRGRRCVVKGRSGLRETRPTRRRRRGSRRRVPADVRCSSVARGWWWPPAPVQPSRFRG